jgi:dienelactone hydrolase
VIEHPVLIPTSQGPAGGIVCEPAGPSRAALVFFHTGGHSGRSGFNSEWAVLSRRLALLGATVLRLDLSTEADSLMLAEEVYPGSGPTEERLTADARLVPDVGEWFHARTAGMDLIAVGACYGCRLALRLASIQAVSATLMVVPYFRPNTDEDRGRWKERMLRVKANQPTDDLDALEPGGLAPLDPGVVDEFEAALRRGPAWILVGERDVTVDALALEGVFGDRGLEVDVEPGEGLYPGDGPPTQELVGDRIVARVSRCLDSAGQPSPAAS